MKFLLSTFLFCLLLVKISFGQADSVSTESKAPLKVGGYVAGLFERSPVDPGYTNTYGFQFALLLGNHFQVGGYGSEYNNDNYQKQLIFPRHYQMNYKHGGLIIGYGTNFDKKYQFLVETRIGFGEVKWDELEDNQTFVKDKFVIYQPQISLEYRPIKYLAINGYIGYRWMTGLDITGLVNDDFTGWTTGLLLKIGKFK